jgi:hypothetical protein
MPRGHPPLVRHGGEQPVGLRAAERDRAQAAAEVPDQDRGGGDLAEAAVGVV